MTPLDVRVAAAQATREAFCDQAFEWGVRDCVRLAAHDLKGLGYRPRLSRGGYYKTALSARKALKRTGFATLEAALDDLGLARLPWAYALPGDIVALPSAEDWPALGVVMDQTLVLAFAPDGVCRLAKPAAADILCLWSAAPCLKPR